MIGIVFLIFFVALILGLPVGIAVSTASLSAGIIDPFLPASAAFVFRNMVTAIDSTALLAIPLFIFSGNIMAQGGISKRLFDFFAYFFGNLPGGIPATVIVTTLFYAATTGSGPATVAAVGVMTIPILAGLGYDKGFATAMVAAAGGLGVILPPSIPFIVYGLSSGQSIGSLFIAGIIPGILVAFCLIVCAVVYCLRRGEDKVKLADNYYQIRSKGFLGLFKNSFFALLAPVIILGGIYSGVVTPTEAANISVVYAIIVSLVIYRTLKPKDLINILRTTITTVAPVLLIVSAATVFGRVLTLMNAPQEMSAMISSIFTSRVALMLAINFFLLFIGLFMETLACILILAPILMPIINTIGVDPIHFGVIMVVNLSIGFFTPPVGISLFIASSITGLPVMTIAKKAIPFVLTFIVALMLITFIPEISLVLINR